LNNIRSTSIYKHIGSPTYLKDSFFCIIILYIELGEIMVSLHLAIAADHVCLSLYATTLEDHATCLPLVATNIVANRNKCSRLVCESFSKKSY
jgi:hypothetical protein